MAAAARYRELWPDRPAGWHLGSITALMSGQAQPAFELVDAWLRTHPSDAQCLLQKAECLFALGRREAMLAAADAAMSAAGGLPEALDALGAFLVQAGEHARALQAYDQALAAAPADVSLLGKRAVIHRYLGNFALAASDLEAVLAASPGDVDALKGLVELSRQSPDHNRVRALEGALAEAPPRSKQAETLHYALAKSYDDLGEYPKSWHHVSHGNRLMRSRVRYDPALDRDIIERILEGFPQLELPAPDTTGESPIFIVGLPRTGTTLVERIIGRHPEVHAAGELPALSEALSATAEQLTPAPPRDWLEFTESWPRLDPAVIAREYLARARARRGDRPRFSDKQPTNFFHCALILRAFPRAKIVHMTRHPLAACHAIYKIRFAEAFPFAYDLRELGDFYIGYRRLMAHWHRVLPGRILDVAYEDVVSALEPTTRSLLEYLGLPFEPQCLDFHLNPASTSTASAVQVRQTLYDSSLRHWRHYAQELAPLAEQLKAGGIPVD